jgi:hypothetical protein
MENIGINVPNPFTMYDYFRNRIRPLSSTASVLNDSLFSKLFSKSYTGGRTQSLLLFSQSNQVLTGAVLRCRQQ